MNHSKACTVANHISHKILTKSFIGILERAYADKVTYGAEPTEKITVHTYVGYWDGQWTPVREEEFTDDGELMTRYTYYYIEGVWERQPTGDMFGFPFDREDTVFKYVYR